MVTLLLTLMADAERAGAEPPEVARVPGGLSADFSRVRAESGAAISDAMLVVAVAAWVTLFGAVSFEVFGQYGHCTFAEPGQLFDAVIDLVATTPEDPTQDLLVPMVTPGSSPSEGSAPHENQTGARWPSSARPTADVTAGAVVS